MSDSSNNTSGGIGFCGLLTVLIIGLKLGHVINWSWWWVLCPIWIGVVFWASILLFVLVIALIVSANGTSKKAETFEPRAGKTLGL